jgi:16S rRNA (guanine527-N7)-methyltransferase
MDAWIETAESMLGLELTPRQVEQFAILERELLDWNARFNLTAIRDPQEMRIKHFLDSLTCQMAFRGQPPTRLCDIGTGAGFPGLPLKILYPDMRLTLVESIGKKLTFCQHAAESLGLSGVEFLNTRAEDIGRLRGHREAYDWVTARAVANLPVLCEYLLPLVQPGGSMLAQKGSSAPMEARAAEKAIRVLGGGPAELIPVQLPGLADERWLVVVKKEKPTPAAYPRRVGIPAKTPIQS